MKHIIPSADRFRRSTERALFILALVTLAVAALFFASAWYFRLKPLEPDWGVWGTWVGSIGTILGFIAAIITLSHNESRRRDDIRDARLTQGKMVAVTSLVSFEPAKAQWETHKGQWTEPRACEGLPSMEERDYLRSFNGPWIGRIEWTVQNGSSYPIVDLLVSGDTSQIFSDEAQPSQKESRPPALLPGGTLSGKWEFEARSRPAEESFPDVAQIRFRDVWGTAWISASKGSRPLV